MIAKKYLVAAAVLLFSSNASAQNAAYDSAYLAWERGDYIRAVDGMLRVLRSPQADALHERIALLTGELYVTTEIAPDGRNIRWSPDGHTALYEVGTQADRVTHVLEYATIRRKTLAKIHAIRGYGAVFSADSRSIAAVRSDGNGIVVTAVGDGRVLTEVPAPGITIRSLASNFDNLMFIGVATGDTTTHVYRIDPQGQPVTSTNNRIQDLIALARFTAGLQPALSTDRTRAVYVTRQGNEYALEMLTFATGDAVTLKKSASPIGFPSFSPDGNRITFQMMPREDWEVYVVDANGENEKRLTREIQHDQFPRFMGDRTVLAMMGEGRHRRSYLYDVDTGNRTRLFHNNMLRTVSQEYLWSVHPDGKSVLIVADRDGNTISPERGVYATDLDAKVTRGALIQRLQDMRTHEAALQARGRALFAPVRTRVAAAVADVSTTRIYGYANDLYQFDSKFITKPGNQLAIQYLERRLREMGYEPELQWFEPRPGVRTANVIATLKGTTHPDRVYVISSHFDSVEPSPGADDNTSGTSALLEAARVLSKRPQPATIQFAFFTGEEAGLLGSREYVRRAVANKVQIAGALNNDMVGWKNDQRLDNTIRYSSDWVRDVQHAAAFLFTNLITYDSRYYQNTDAHAYYEAYGDIVGGIGSYPILGNPHYHQSHDVLETVDQQLVAEVSKTTIASIMLMASKPTLPR